MKKEDDKAAVGWVIELESGEWYPDHDIPFQSREDAIRGAVSLADDDDDDDDFDKPVALIPLYAGKPEPIEAP